MHAATDRLEFAPPDTPGLLRALILAILAHVLLVAALSVGVQWKRDAEAVTFDAELWSAVPAEAAPKLLELPPEPPAPIRPERPIPVPKPEPPAPEPPKVDIALQQEKLRLKKQHQIELEKLKQEQLKQDKEKLKQEKLKQEKLKQEQLKQDKQKQDQAKKEAQKHEQADRVIQATLDKKKTELEAKQLESQRVKNLARMTGMAGATGTPGATGTALKSSGPSAGYAGRIRARVKPNIVFTGEVQANPTTEVEVRTSSNGTIISRKITKSSGVKSWDDAVLNAIDKTEMLPRDVDGSVPSSLLLVFQPKD